MHVNIYESEVTLDIKLVTKDERDTQGHFVRHMYGLRFVTAGEYEDGNSDYVDARGAVTFWSTERNLADDFAERLLELSRGLGLS